MPRRHKKVHNRQKMASPTSENKSTCVMCFESRTLKVVGRCNHSFCAECLSSVQELEGTEEVFQCPTCRSECPRPWNGVDGLADFTADRCELTELDVHDVGTVAAAEEDKSHGEVQIICEVCDHKIKKKVKAVNICTECDHVNICQACSEKHKKSKATRHHILTPIVSKTQQKASKCDLHDKNLTNFCQTCNTSICNICVLTDHEDHDVERFGDTIRREIEKTNLTLNEMETKFKMLQHLQQELVQLNAIAPQVDKQDVLIKQIEDRAQEVIDEVTRWKEDTKQEVRVKFQIIRDIRDDLGKVSEMVKKFWAQINQGRAMLSKTENQPMYLEKLFALKRELEQTEKMGNGLEGKKHSDILNELRDEDNRFQADMTPVSPGEIVGNDKRVVDLVEVAGQFSEATFWKQKSYAFADAFPEAELPAGTDVFQRSRQDFQAPWWRCNMLLKQSLRNSSADKVGSTRHRRATERGWRSLRHENLNSGHPS